MFNLINCRLCMYFLRRRNFLRFGCACIIYVSQSDILGPIDYLGDIENLVSFERVMFGDYSFKYKIQIFLLFMSIPQL